MSRVLGVLVSLVLLAGAAWLVLRDDAVLEESGAGPRPGAHEEGGPELLTKGAPPAVAKATSKGADARALLRGFQSEDPAERQAAVDAAISAERIAFDEEFVRLMVAGLAAGDPTIVKAAYTVLLGMGPRVVPFLGPLLHSPKGYLRVQALQFFSIWRDREIPDIPYPPLVPFLEEEDGAVIVAAAHLVTGGLPYEEDLVAWLLAKAAADWDGFLRPAIGLARMGPRGVAHVVAMLEKPAQVRRALEGLRFAASEDLKPHVRLLAPFIADGSDEVIQAAAIGALKPLEGDCEEVLPALRRALTSESQFVRRAVMGVFVHMGERALPALVGIIEALEDEDERVAGHAVGTLEKMQSAPERVLPALRAALDSDVGDGAGDAMGAFGAAAVPYLRDALDEPEGDVVYFALGGAHRLGAQARPLVERIIALLDADDSDIQERAAHAVGQLGPVGAPAIPKLLELLHEGTLQPEETARVLRPMGHAAEEAVLANFRIGSEEDRLRLVAMLAKQWGWGGFALDALAPYMRHADARVRGTAIGAVCASIWDQDAKGALHAKDDPALRRRVRALLAALPNDANEYNASLIKGTFAEIDKFDR